MFKHIKTVSSFAARDLKKIKTFYQEVLGLEVSGTDDLLSLHIAGGYKIWVYVKPDHVPATYTVLNFPVDNLEETVDLLIARGIQFLQYEGDLQTDKKGIFRGDGPKIAWFTDPAGNILSVLEESSMTTT